MIQRLPLYGVSFYVLLLTAPHVRADEIHDLIENGAIEKVKLLIAKNPELKQARDKMMLTPLHTAVSAGNVEIVKYLLEQGVDVNAEAYNRFTPLHFAEDPKIIELLVTHKANLEAESAAGTPLQMAAGRLWDGDTSDYAKKGRAMTKALLAAGAKYDILSAVYLGDLDRVKAIVKADPKEALNKDAMRKAARGGHVAIVQYLLDNKGDPDDADFGGITVLYFALQHPEVVKVLIRAGANVKTPLKDKRKSGSGPLPDGCTIPATRHCTMRHFGDGPRSRRS